MHSCIPYSLLKIAFQDTMDLCSLLGRKDCSLSCPHASYTYRIAQNISELGDCPLIHQSLPIQTLPIHLKCKRTLNLPKFSLLNAWVE